MRSKPKKRLGQNFLVDKNIRAKIINACDFSADDVVIEIGPGRGELTRFIAQKVKKLIAIELDRDLCEDLRNSLAAYPNAKVIHGDILKTDLARYLKGCKHQVKVFGNIPYYITTPILEQLFKFRKAIKTVFLTVQKEFAVRLIAPAGSRDYGSLSCFVGYHCQPRLLFAIKKTCFWPKPKVDSSFLRLDFKQYLPLAKNQEKRLFAMVRAAFSQRRKKIKNSLSRLIANDRLSALFKDCALSPDARAQNLSLADFTAITFWEKKSKKILTKP